VNVAERLDPVIRDKILLEHLLENEVFIEQLERGEYSLARQLLRDLRILQLQAQTVPVIDKDKYTQ